VFLQAAVPHCLSQRCFAGLIMGKQCQNNTENNTPTWLMTQASLANSYNKTQNDSTSDYMCVLTQHYLSTTFISLHFHSCKENFGAGLKYVVISIFLHF
jgi:hypothetical protein